MRIGMTRDAQRGDCHHNTLRIAHQKPRPSRPIPVKDHPRNPWRTKVVKARHITTSHDAHTVRTARGSGPTATGAEIIVFPLTSKNNLKGPSPLARSLEPRMPYPLFAVPTDATAIVSNSPS